MCGKKACAKLSIAITAMALLAWPSTAAELGKIYEIVSMEGKASITHKSVRRIAETGSLLYEGDILEIRNRSVVDIALDEGRRNIVSLRGLSYISRLRIRNSEIEVQHGETLVSADGEDWMTVTTPSSASKGTSTFFRVGVDGTESEIMVLEGAVMAYGREASGRVVTRPRIVKRGTKTTVDGYSRKPTDAVPLTDEDIKDIKKNARDIQRVREALDEIDYQSRISEAGEEPTSLINTTEIESDRNKRKKIVY